MINVCFYTEEKQEHKCTYALVKTNDGSYSIFENHQDFILELNESVIELYINYSQPKFPNQIFTNLNGILIFKKNKLSILQ
jgi:F0F1-type ATP synthase epsilon subunit